MRVLGNIAVVEIGNSQIEYYAEYKSKAKQGGINPVFKLTNLVLNGAVNPQYPKWFYG